MSRPFANAWVFGATAGLLVLSWPGWAEAQTRSMFGNSSSSATSLGRSSNSSGFSSLTSSSASRGQSGLGQSGFGQTGQSGFGQQSQFGATTGQRQGMIGQPNTGGRLIGGNQALQGAVQGNQFGGNQFGANTGLQGLSRRGATGGRGGLGGAFGQGGGGFGGQGGDSTGSRYPNPQLKIGFEPVATPPAQLTMAVTTRIAKVDAAHGLAEVVALAYDTEAGTIVLTGTVRTEQLRKKAEHLVRFEPGVREVRNEIVVASDVP
jgi:hypothetical protein